MSDQSCFFEFKYNCSEFKEEYIHLGSARINSVIEYSKIYEDGKYEYLEKNISKDNFSIQCHKSCVSTYTSTVHKKRLYKTRLQEKRKQVECVAGPSKRIRVITGKIFSFKEHCVFCGEDCILTKDPKNPKRWRAAYLCRQLKLKGKNVTFNQAVLDVCAARNDDWSNDVERRIRGAVSDLHAADARYHVDCRNKFMTPVNIKYAASSKSKNADDEAIKSLIECMSSEKNRTWTMVELYDEFRAFGGKLTKDYVAKKIKEHFGDQLLVFSSPGYANVYLFKSNASKFMTLVKDETDDIDYVLSKVANRIKSEYKDIDVQKSHYSTQITLNEVLATSSYTMMELLRKISPKLDNSMPAALIASIITNILINHPTSLQIALGVLVRESKLLINQLYAFRITCSYDEVLRYKKSAAVAITKDSNLKIIKDSREGMVQVIVDNFDADISSPNGKLSTHSLAVIVAQKDSNQTVRGVDYIPRFRRLNKKEMSKPIDYNHPIVRYQGPKNPEMPVIASLKQVSPLKVLAHQVLSKSRSESVDLDFLNKIIKGNNVPEFNGFNTAETRRQGQSIQLKSNTEYTPLIDMSPSDPDTMMSALVQAQNISSGTGQDFVIFTCDLQLYKVAQKILWAYPKKFENVILRLGGMHLLMSFIGAIGNLMAESGLVEIMEYVFGGVSKMISGKKFPQNMRAMRLVMEELVRDIIIKNGFMTYESLIYYLDDIASKSKTSMLWIDCFIKPIFLMMQYVRAEREGDWSLHLLCVKRMLPYFYSGSHIHYARYGLLYLRSMESLPYNVLNLFLKGEHVMRHIPGLWNGIWSDMFIESTFMRYGHGPGGIIGITLKPETLKKWALSLHLCNSLEASLSDMIDGKNENSQTTHSEEGTSRIKSDSKDRDGLRTKIQMVIDPLDPEQHPENIVNIVTGRVGPKSVNVHKSIEIGIQQMQEFEKGWPEGFIKPIEKRVITMAITKKHVKIDDQKVFDTSLIYSRVIGLQVSSRKEDIRTTLKSECAPFATSMFTAKGEMRISKSKATLKKKIQVEVSARTTSPSDTVIIDGSAFLWVVNWPSGGTVKHYIQNFKSLLHRRLLSENIYLVFDRYHVYSIKSITRSSRTKEASRIHKLSLDVLLPPQNVVLGVTANKIQLIDMICSELVKDITFHQKSLQSHKIVITGENKTPVEISNGGVVIHRHDMNTTHEEADVIIVQQLLLLLQESPKGITVVCDDTDVFILLLHYYLKETITIPIFMESPIRDRAVIDIRKTVDKHKPIVSNLLAAHALSGCDTVASCFGIGKVAVIKVLRSGLQLSTLGNIDADMADVMKEATKFMVACYGFPKCNSMSEARFTVWSSKIGKASTKMPELSSLPPTDESFAENVKRAHFQVCIWKSVKFSDPPVMDVQKFGWKKDIENKILEPVTVPPGVALIPESILKLIHCNCKSEDSLCKTHRCGCKAGNLPCTIFCNCRDLDCSNQLVE